MSAFSSLTVNDRESTPVAHTFVPQERTNGLAKFHNAGSVPIADENLTVSWRTLSNGKRKVRLVLAVPSAVTETVNGVDVVKVPRTAFADVTFTFDGLSTEQERANTVGLLANALSSSVTVINDTVVGLEGIY